MRRLGDFRSHRIPGHDLAVQPGAVHGHRRGTCEAPDQAVGGRGHGILFCDHEWHPPDHRTHRRWKRRIAAERQHRGGTSLADQCDAAQRRPCQARRGRHVGQVDPPRREAPAAQRGQSEARSRHELRVHATLAADEVNPLRRPAPCGQRIRYRQARDEMSSSAPAGDENARGIGDAGSCRHDSAGSPRHVQEQPRSSAGHDERRAAKGQERQGHTGHWQQSNHTADVYQCLQHEPDRNPCSEQ